MPDETLTAAAERPAPALAIDELARATLLNDELIDRTLIRNWLLWGFFWLMLAPTVGVLVSTKFTMTTGLDGTPMPSFADAMEEAERWAISYYVLAFSAFSDPLTGDTLRLDAATRARLNEPGALAYGSSRLALDPASPDRRAGLVRFYKGMLGEGR